MVALNDLETHLMRMLEQTPVAREEDPEFVSIVLEKGFSGFASYSPDPYALIQAYTHAAKICGMGIDVGFYATTESNNS